MAFRIMGYLLIFSVIGAVVFVFVKSLVFNEVIQDLALQQSVISASVGVTVVCLIAWILNLLGFVRLRDGWAKLLWVVLISSILGNSAIIYKKWVSRSDVVVKTLCLRPLAEKLDKEEAPELRLNTTFKRGERIPYLLSLKDVSVDESGAMNAVMRSSLEKEGDRTAVFHDDPLAGNVKAIRENAIARMRHDQFRSLAPECVPEGALAIGFLKSFRTDNFSSGSYKLKVTVFDYRSNSFATIVLPVDIVE